MKLADQISTDRAPMNGVLEARASRMNRHLAISLDCEQLHESTEVIPFRKVRGHVRTARYYAWSPGDTTALLSSLDHAQRKLRNIKRLLGESDEPVDPRAA